MSSSIWKAWNTEKKIRLCTAPEKTRKGIFQLKELNLPMARVVLKNGSCILAEIQKLRV